MQPNTLKKLFLALVIFVIAACGRIAPTATPNVATTSVSPPVASTAPVPAEFQSLYTELDSALNAFDQSFDASGNYPVTFAAELLPANGNRGAALLEPQTLAGVRVNLDALQKMGVQGVTIAIKYPMLTSDFPNSAQYLEFFKSVAAEVRKRNMKMDVEVGVIFPPPFSSLNMNYKGLTLDQYKAKNRQMVTTIINEIKPDYLNLGSEPDTEAAITGIRELNNPQGYTDLINYTLKDLDRGNTKIGAGLGTWASLDFVKSEAAYTSLDFISLHVYPVTGKALQTAVQAADIAHQFNKRVIMDEMWLYKTSANEPPASIAANSDIFRRDAYSFWIPLDQKFLATMAKLARAKNIEYVSAFWATNFFGYLNYDSKLQTLPYNDLVTQLNTEASRNILAGKLSQTGEYYKQLSRGPR